MKIYGLIGNPLGHSFSQRYFDQKFRHAGIQNTVYLNFEIPDLEEGISMLKAKSGLYGLNVTIPYKSQIISYLDIVSEVCKEINACNCIKIDEKGWSGFNTDVVGFEKTFILHLNSSNKKALILGTGGSSKAVAYVLKKLEIDFLFVSRNKDLRSGIISYAEVTEALMREYKIVINTTPVGMFPNVDVSPPLPYSAITSEHYLFDLIYNPAETAFLKQGRLKGATTQNGEKMLVIQAEESWEIWNSE
ncbi:MAG: shikimate dehydrogenase [Ginsengibacter sp.]